MKLGAPSTTKTASMKVDYVKAVLSSWSKPWMLVFDNYDHPGSFASLRAYFPSGKYSMSWLFVHLSPVIHIVVDPICRA